MWDFTQTLSACHHRANKQHIFYANCIYNYIYFTHHKDHIINRNEPIVRWHQSQIVGAGENVAHLPESCLASSAYFKNLSEDEESLMSRSASRGFSIKVEVPVWIVHSGVVGAAEENTFLEVSPPHKSDIVTIPCLQALTSWPYPIFFHSKPCHRGYTKRCNVM